MGSGEIAQRLRALPAILEVLSLIPSNHRVAGKHLQWDVVSSSGVHKDRLLIYIKEISILKL